MEAAALVAKALLAGAQGAEVLCNAASSETQPNRLKKKQARTGSLGDDISAELHDDTSNGGAVGGHVEEYFRLAKDKRTRNVRSHWLSKTAGRPATKAAWHAPA